MNLLWIVFTSSLISYAAAASVRVHPETVKAVMDANGTASFHCEVEGAGLGWLINGTDAQDFYGADVKIIPLGVVHGVVSYSSDLNVSTAKEFDNLQIVCRAIGTTKEDTVDSNVAWLRLKDLVIPQCHNIQYYIMENSIVITWLCGLVEHVELYYNVTISRDGDDKEESVIMQTNKTFISFELEHPFAELCTNYTFSVVAWSELDASDPSEPVLVTAGFPCPPALMPTVLQDVLEPSRSTLEPAVVTTTTPVSLTPTTIIIETMAPEVQMHRPSSSLVIVISVAVPMGIVILVLTVMVATLLFVIYYMHERKSKLAPHEGSDVPVVMRGNDAYQMVKISRTGRDGVDMDQCPAYGVVGKPEL